MERDQVTYFSPLPADECRSLLREVEYGRVAWAGSQGITVLPVNFRMVDDSVVFHTAPGTLLSEIADGAQVAFQVDDVDADAAIGWTVMLRGTTKPAPEHAAPVSWMSGERPLGIMIVEETLSGRAIAGTKKEQA